MADPTQHWPSSNPRGYTIPDLPYGTRRPLKVVGIGAGISGISLSHDIQADGDNIELTMYEMASDYGGTWFWNTYPGCRCDIPSVNYQMSWSPKPDWPEFYSTAPEIQKYYKGLVDKFNLHKYFRLSHEVIKAEWIDDRKKWSISIRGPNGVELEDEADIFINGGGVLNNYKWPEIKGLSDFKGTLCHTARWPADLDLKGKRVAIIGSGSSGIQLLATVQPEAGRIFHWIRSPTWITTAFAQQFAGPDGKNFSYSEEQKKLFADDPEHALKYRKMIESELNKRFRFIVKGTPEQQAALLYSKEDMKRRLKNDPRLVDAIIPKDFNVGCRRPTPGNGYLEALLEDNVTVYTEMFQRFTEKGFIDAEGQEVEVDVVVCATGFNTSFIPRFPIIAKGVNIQDRWKNYPIDSYMSIAVKDVPNYFMYYGPNGPNGHGSGAPMIECLTRCFVDVFKKMQRECISSIQPREKAVQDFNEHRELYLQRTAWSGNCSSWFRPSLDVSPIMWPGNRVLFIELLTNFRWEDFDYEYSTANNRFGHLGNGFTMRELDGRDTTFYYGLLQDSEDVQPDYSDLLSLYSRQV